MNLRPSRAATLLAASLLLALAAPASALEYRSTQRPALLYDAPSTAAGKLAIAGSGLPLEVVVELEAWVKVRDHGGRLSWIEKAALGGPRHVMIKAASSSIRSQPQPDANIVFSAQRGVLLEIAGELNAFGWLPVRHRDGQAGWLPVSEVWGR